MISLCGLSWNNLILSPEPRGWRKTSLLSISRTVTGTSGVRVLIKSNKPAQLGERWRRGNPEKPKWSVMDVGRRGALWKTSLPSVTVHGQTKGSRHTTRVSGRPRGDALCRTHRRSLSQHGISAAARRLRLHWEATHAGHQSDKRRSRLHSTSIFLRFVSMQQRNWSVGGDVSLSDVILAKTHLKTANSLLQFLVNNLRASLSSWWNSPTFTSSACFTFQTEISPLWCHKDHKHPMGSLPGLFLAPSKSAEGPTKQPFLFLFWRGERYYHNIIHKINHEIPLRRSPGLKSRSKGRVLCSRHTVNLEVGHMQMRWSRQFAWGPVLPTPPLHEP